MNKQLPRFLLTAAAALTAAAPFTKVAAVTWSENQTYPINDTQTYTVTSGEFSSIAGVGDPGPIVEVGENGRLIFAGESHPVYVGHEFYQNGTLNIIQGGIVESAGTFHIWGNFGGSGKISVSGDGSALKARTLRIAESYGPGTLEITKGGAVTAENLMVASGSVGGLGVVSIGGIGSSLNVTQRIYVGYFSNGTLTIEDNASVTSPEVKVGVTSSVGVLNLRTGGILNTRQISAIPEAGGIATVNINGGIIRSLSYNTYWSNDFFQHLGTITLSNEGLSLDTPALTFDTNEYNVTSSADGSTTFTGVGGFTKTGAGTFTLTGAHSYTGTTTVSGGIESVLKVTGTLRGGLEHPGDIVLVGGAKITFNPTAQQKFSGSLSGTGTIGFDVARSVIVAGTLSPGAAPGTTGTLTFQNSSDVSFSSGAQFVVDLLALEGADANDLLIVSNGNLVLDGGQLVLRRGKSFPLWGSPEGSEIVIAKVAPGGEITGMFANVDPDTMEVTDASGRRAFVSVRENETGGKDLILTIYPEPSTYALFGGAGALLLAFWRKRKQRKAAK